MRPAAILALLLLLFGCAAPPRSPESRAAGFTLLAAVHSPADPPPPRTPPPPRAHRPARHIVETDGILRSIAGPQALAITHPPQVRRLSPWQLDDIWQLIRAAGLHDENHPGRAPPVSPLVPHPHLPTALFEITLDFAPRTIHIVLDDSHQAAAATRLLDHLAELAWITP
jgi:hypothetical protein